MVTALSIDCSTVRDFKEATTYGNVLKAYP